MLEVVRERTQYVESVNARFLLNDDVWSLAAVEDVTPALRSAAEAV